MIAIMSAVGALYSCGDDNDVVEPTPPGPPVLEHKLTVSATSLTFAPETKGSQTITVIAENVEWGVQNAAEAGWLHVEKIFEGVSMKVDRNVLSGQREAKFTITSNISTVKPVEITVVQKGVDDLFLDTNPKELIFENENNPVKEITVVAGKVNWTVEILPEEGGEQPEWLHIETVEDIISVTVDNNEAYDPREAKLKISPDRPVVDPVEISINQKETPRPDPVLEADVESIEFKANDNTPTIINVTAVEVTWKAEVSPDAASWLHIGTDGDKITVVADDNPFTGLRTGSISIIPEDDDRVATVVIPVTQKPRVDVIMPTEVDFEMVYLTEYMGDRYDKGTGYFNVTFMNVENAQDAIFESFRFEGFMPLAADGTQGYIAVSPGTYTYEFNENYTGTAYTFLSYYSVMSRSYGTSYTSTMQGTDHQILFPVFGGTLTIEDKGGGNYAFEANVVDHEGTAAKFTYTGPLQLDNIAVPKPVVYDVTTTRATCFYEGQFHSQNVDQISLYLAGEHEEGKDKIRYFLSALFYVPRGTSTEIPVGRYLAEGVTQKNPFTYQKGSAPYGLQTIFSYRTYLYGDSSISVNGDGYIDVAKNSNGIYTITAVMEGRNDDTRSDATVKVLYTGEIDIQDRSQ